jgi:hypothetical protein
MHEFQRKSAGFAPGVLAVSILLGACSTSWGISPTGGINLDNQEFLVGADAWFPFQQDLVNVDLAFAPSLAWYPSVELNEPTFAAYADLATAFPTGARFEPFVRGGLGLSRRSYDGAGRRNNSDTDLRLHLAAGGHIGEPGTDRPWGQVGLALGNGSDLYLAAGYRFIIRR